MTPKGATAPCPPLAAHLACARPSAATVVPGGRRRDQERPAGGCETIPALGPHPAPKHFHVGAGRVSGGSKRGCRLDSLTRSLDDLPTRPGTGRRLMLTGAREADEGLVNRQIRRLVLKVRQWFRVLLAQLRSVVGSSQLSSLPSRTGWWTATGTAIQSATAPSARSADQPPAEVAGWNHPIRVTTVPPAGSRVTTTVTPRR
jgi:hypothetical protein